MEYSLSQLDITQNLDGNIEGFFFIFGAFRVLLTGIPRFVQE